MNNSKKLGLTLIILLLITTATILYGDGWRVSIPKESKSKYKITKPKIQKTGMLAIRSIPKGAKVYLNGKPVTATDDTISSLPPGKYNVVVKKDGFETWTKEIEVFPELVTDITAVLVLQSPKLEPLTNNDVSAYDMAHNYNDVAYITKDNKHPGIWKLSLVGTPINLLKHNSKPLITDTDKYAPSLGEDIWWSPDDSELLVKMNDKGYLLYKLNQTTEEDIEPQSITDLNSVLERWQIEYENDFLNDKINEVSQQDEFPQWLDDYLNTYRSTWSPDEQKFFIIKSDKYLRNSNDNTDENDAETTKRNNDAKSNKQTSNDNSKQTDATNENKSDNKQIDVIVYNSETPLPVGERRLTFPIKIDNPDNVHIYWYSDSYHLIIVTEDPKIPNYYTIELVRIDGTNKTTIYSGLLASYKAYPTPSGDRILVLTSLKENSPTNLYGISIR